MSEDALHCAEQMRTDVKEFISGQMRLFMINLKTVSKTGGRCCDTERTQERKVRASQGRVPDNVWRRRLQGQCNRNVPPQFLR